MIIENLEFASCFSNIFIIGNVHFLSIEERKRRKKAETQRKRGITLQARRDRVRKAIHNPNVYKNSRKSKRLLDKIPRTRNHQTAFKGRKPSRNFATRKIRDNPSKVQKRKSASLVADEPLRRKRRRGSGWTHRKVSRNRKARRNQNANPNCKTIKQTRVHLSGPPVIPIPRKLRRTLKVPDHSIRRRDCRKQESHSSHRWLRSGTRRTATCRNNQFIGNLKTTQRRKRSEGDGRARKPTCLQTRKTAKDQLVSGTRSGKIWIAEVGSELKNQGRRTMKIVRGSSTRLTKVSQNETVRRKTNEDSLCKCRLLNQKTIENLPEKAQMPNQEKQTPPNIPGCQFLLGSGQHKNRQSIPKKKWHTNEKKLKEPRKICTVRWRCRYEARKLAIRSRHRRVRSEKHEKNQADRSFRRSPRLKTESVSFEETLIEQIEAKKDELQIEKFEVEGKGWGIRSLLPIRKGDFVVEYIGELIKHREALQRDQAREIDEEIGCFMFYFKHDSVMLCIDSTDYPKHKGRYVNHSKKLANLEARVITVQKQPRLFLVARRDIAVNEELLINYGDDRKEAKENHPWLKD